MADIGGSDPGVLNLTTNCVALHNYPEVVFATFYVETL